MIDFLFGPLNFIAIRDTTRRALALAVPPLSHFGS